MPEPTNDSLIALIAEITESEALLNQGLLRVDELRIINQKANHEYELASDHNSIQYRKYDKARRSVTRWTPQRRNGYAEPEDGEGLRILKQEIIELLHMRNVEIETTEVFLPPGEPFTGRVVIRNILSRAATSIDIKDDYLFSANKGTKNIELLAILSPYMSTSLGLKIRLLGASDNPPASTASDIALFIKQYPGVEIKGYSHSSTGDKETHGRFIIIDGKEVYVPDSSLKDLGLAQSLITQIDDEANINNYLQLFDRWWGEATTYTNF